MSDLNATSQSARARRWTLPGLRTFANMPVATRRTVSMAALHIVLVWTLAVALVWQNYHQSVESWKRATEAISLTVAAYASQSLRAADLVLRNLADTAQDQHVDTPERFNEVMGSRGFFDGMRESLVGLPQAGRAGVVDADGELVSWSDNWPPPKLNVAERERFKGMFAAAAGTIFVSATGGSGESRFYLARQIRTKSGALLGLVAISLNTSYFEAFFRRLPIGADSWISLFRADGTLLASSLRNESQVGRRLVDSVAYRLFSSGRSGMATITEGPYRLGNASPTGGPRIMVTCEIDDFPTFVAAAIGESTFLGPWRERTALIAIIAFVLTALTVLAAVRFIRLAGRAEENRRIERQNQVLEAIVDTPSALTAIADRTGRVLHSNARFREVMQRGGNPAHVLLDPALKGREKLLAFAADGKGAARAEVDLQLDQPGQETRRLHFSLARQTLPGAGECTILVGHDETLRFRAQQAVAMSTKLVTLGEITTSIAHEVSQPLNVIRMAAQNALLEGEPEPDPEPGEEPLPLMSDGEFRQFALSKFHGIIRQVDRAATVLARMRIFNRKGESEETFDLREAIGAAVALMRKRLDADHIKVVEALGPDPLPVKGSRTLFEQGVIYLLRNAHEALQQMPPGTPRTVEVTAGREGAGRIALIVRDNGPGVPEALAERIFEPFFSTKPTEQHVGLGLSLVFGGVRDMGGSVMLLAGGTGAALKIVVPEASAPLRSEAIAG